MKKGWIIGTHVANTVYVRRNGKLVPVAKYEGTRKVWDEKKNIPGR